MFFISSIMHKKLEMIWHVFHVMMWECMVEVCADEVMFRFGVILVMR